MFNAFLLQRIAVPFALLFLAGVGASVFVTGLPPQLLWFYLAASLFTFVVYVVDKAAARNGTWRVPESKLHLLALVGGWPGAICGQQWLRHKSSKASFRSGLWLTVLANCAAFAGLFSQTGGAMLQSLLEAI